jgi:hypothetical protein
MPASGACLAANTRLLSTPAVAKQTNSRGWTGVRSTESDLLVSSCRKQHLELLRAREGEALPKIEAYASALTENFLVNKTT